MLSEEECILSRLEVLSSDSSCDFVIFCWSEFHLQSFSFNVHFIVPGLHAFDGYLVVYILGRHL